MSELKIPSENEILRILDSCLSELQETGSLGKGSLVVLGCSTSEVAGSRIGHGSVPALGEAIARAMVEACRARGFEPVFQCCEHLNRALVMEAETLRELRLTRVHAVPQPKAGGSVPAAAWRQMQSPRLALAIQADAGIDIGDTLVGMHIRPVAVPLRPSRATLGGARIVMAYSRPMLIGGARAVYTENA